MCGRFANNKPIDQLKTQYHATSNVAWNGSYNIAPTELAPIVIDANGEHRIGLAKFGIPKTANGRIFPLLNIQSEKAANRKDLVSRRCIIPATGFYEWLKVSEKDRQPYYFTAQEGILSLAGVWEKVDDVTSFAIFTTRPNELLEPIHNRMPVVLGHNAVTTWLAPDTDTETLLGFMQPVAAGTMQMRKVSKEVNSVRNKGESCIASLADV